MIEEWEPGKLPTDEAIHSLNATVAMESKLKKLRSMCGQDAQAFSMDVTVVTCEKCLMIQRGSEQRRN